VKNFTLQDNEKSDLLSMFALTVLTPQASSDEEHKIEHVLEGDLH
jgi:hypothetical protein